jgi:hypothetical protein
MKRVVGGKAYNTDTAERIARREGTYDKSNSSSYEAIWAYEIVLYRTPKGAYFTVEREWPDGSEDKARSHFEALSLDEALAWVRREQCELLNDAYFPAFEDA